MILIAETRLISVKSVFIHEEYALAVERCHVTHYVQFLHVYDDYQSLVFGAPRFFTSVLDPISALPYFGIVWGWLFGVEFICQAQVDYFFRSILIKF